ncbi:hypothetical protein Clacol_000027 [Clathrus columnatus]|uniref:Fungal-type protein kinase domain-containing protein n=1 Tax=Clathrus columnatus TaxID=1419009 RepID=A0AAV4ZYV7_9AGAM|nr:hypothetical protein Clacol_000027 [Clathrus columnatus]
MINPFPFRRSSTQVTASAAPTRAAKVMEAVKRDINQNVLLVHPDLFIDRLLLRYIANINIDKVVTEVMAKFYDQKAKRWKNFPKNVTTNEETFYPEFIELTSDINTKANELTNVAANRAFGSWVDCHSKTPNANADFVAEIRPDCAYVSNAGVVTGAITTYTDRKRSQSRSEGRSVGKEPKIWWRQMVLAVEVKKVDDKLYLGAFPQLCGYIRQMFRQQLDRRFAFGITISFNQIALWLCDRSGGMGMCKPYDIHKEPEKFVRMICAIALLPSHRIGWDPTLKLYSDALRSFAPSYEIRAALRSKSEIKSGPETTSKTNDDVSNSSWLLTVVDDRETVTKTHEIILAKRPFVIRSAEGMNGRAVQVHQGYPLADDNKTRRCPLVVKTSWQPVEKTHHNRFHEERMYSKVPKLKNRVVAASVVKAGHGLDVSDNTPVSTFNFIRQNLHNEADFHAGAEMNGNVQKLSMYRNMQNADLNEDDKKRIDEMKETMAFMVFDESGITKDHCYFAEEDSLITDRVQTRLILNVWGWPIKFFKDLKELLTVIRDAVEDHQTMFKSGVLHRDVSAENIIIRPALPSLDLPLRELVTKTSGVLIDLDHAKDTDAWKDPKVIADVIREDIQYIGLRLGIKEDAVLHAWKFLPDLAGTSSYCKDAIKLNVLESIPNGKWSPKNLGWRTMEKVPDFGGHVPSANERTGTVPFISHQLMGMRARIVHHAIHDMESFWWVLINLCLTKESGGGRRREDRPKPLRTLIHSLFEDTDACIAVEKALYFNREQGSAIFEELLAWFPEYFEGLKPMLRRWREVLVLGYTYQAYEYHLVHEYVLAIIDGTLTKLAKLPEDDPSSEIEKHLKQRDVAYAYICNIEHPNGVTPPKPIVVPPAGLSPVRNQATAQASSSQSIPEPPSSPSPLPAHKKRKT